MPGGKTAGHLIGLKFKLRIELARQTLHRVIIGKAHQVQRGVAPILGRTDNAPHERCAKSEPAPVVFDAEGGFRLSLPGK